MPLATLHQRCDLGIFPKAHGLPGLEHVVELTDFPGAPVELLLQRKDLSVGLLEVLAHPRDVLHGGIACLPPYPCHLLLRGPELALRVRGGILRGLDLLVHHSQLDLSSGELLRLPAERCAQLGALRCLLLEFAPGVLELRFLVAGHPAALNLLLQLLHLGTLPPELLLEAHDRVALVGCKLSEGAEHLLYAVELARVQQRLVPGRGAISAAPLVARPDRVHCPADDALHAA
mmetsp:Transcript_10478/g.24789  ORF Transcript_10478/g.24789 Transcript_10478/m.24789 type:complete len:232 (-) Transcript_10478:1281-1976(-)